MTTCSSLKAMEEGLRTALNPVDGVPAQGSASATTLLEAATATNCFPRVT